MRSKAIVVTDLTFGDAGKGTIVDFLCRELPVHTVIRHNGGPQAAHNVVTADGRHHTFSQFGSGSFVPGVRTHLSRFMLVDPFLLANEADELEDLGVADIWDRLTIDEEAMIITPLHRAMNHLREIARGDARHGSCGKGIGETMADNIDMPSLTIRAKDLKNPTVLRQKLESLRQRKIKQLFELTNLPDCEISQKAQRAIQDEEMIEKWIECYLDFGQTLNIVSSDYLAKVLQEAEVVVFEGAQGVLIDEWYGFFPYTTWSTTTLANASELLRENNFSGQIIRLGVIRAYATRHGAGPFPTESPELSETLQEQHNDNNQWQREFRVGWFDQVLLNYAISVNGGCDALAVTHLDRFGQVPEWKWCDAYKDSSGEIWSSIKIPPWPVDLGEMEKLTGQLESVQPILSGGPVTTEDFLTKLEKQFSLPVVVTSWGANSNDKRWEYGWSNIWS